MRLTFRHLIHAVAAVGLSLAVAGCETIEKLDLFGTDKYKPEIVAEIPAEQLYSEGLQRLESKNYESAHKKFADVDKQHPYSPLAKKALIMSAYANYEKGDYDEAISSSRRFLTLHPADPDAAYAQYLLAMSYYSQVPDVARDQERVEKAAQALQELVDRYPNSEYVPDAKFRIQVVKDQLAAKEMDVGRYYLKRRNYTAAINRFREVVAKYQTTRHVEEALERLTEAYLALGVVSEAQTAAAVLGHNFPDSDWYRDAHALLARGGLEPREDEGSWISRAFKGLVRTVGIRY